MSLVDDINKFCQDLILGDFEQNPSNAAMIVGGVISLVPVVDQVMDVRDVSGMIYRLNHKGTQNATQDDWVDLALAAFGCIPEVGSLFKTIIKPLWKNRAAWRVGHQGGQAMVEAMNGLRKGRAITYLKTFDWGARTQQAVQQTSQTFTLCDQFLGELAQPRWWIPDSLEGLARDMRPQLARARAPVQNGVKKGAQALEAFVKELLGEDGWAVANMAAATTNNLGGSRAGKRTHSKTPQRPHAQIADTQVQKQNKKAGPVSHDQRATRKDWKMLGAPNIKGLLGEHMAHYYHMQKLGAVHVHGRSKHDQDGWRTPARLVTEQNGPHTPTELVLAHLPRASQSGVDGVWSLGNGQYHFVEAKAYESAGSLFGMAANTHGDGASQSADTNGKKTAKKPSKRKLAPPTGLTERELSLWFMLGQPIKGLQMGQRWLRATVTEDMVRGNKQNRFVYVYFGIDSTSPPKNYTPKAGAKLIKNSNTQISKHIAVMPLMFAAHPDDAAAHDEHKSAHQYSDVFTADEIDAVDDFYRKELKGRPAQSDKAKKSDTATNSEKPEQKPAKTTTRRKK